MPSLTHEINVPFKKATFGMGCFWACDALFGGQHGVLRTRVGYSGGKAPNPEYKKMGDHTEVVEIDYDSRVINFEELLELFWNNHDGYSGLTTRVKRQYMSLILYHDEDQKRLSELSIKKEKSKRNNQELVTEIAPAGIFYPAENYHQKYRLQQHPWLVEELGITAELLQTSHIAARVNAYVSGVGNVENFEKDVKNFNIPEKVADYIRTQLIKNEGGALFC